MKIFLTIAIEENKGERLDKFLTDKINEQEEYKGFFSRNRVQDIIKEGLVRKNDDFFQNSNYRMQVGDRIEAILDDIKEVELKPKDIPLDIVYEDDDLLVINKQAGLTTHPGGGNYEDTLVNALLFHKKDKLSGIGGVLRPGIVHRLDKDTSGLMVVAKNDFAHNNLAKQLQERTLKRTYYAFAWGHVMPPVGQISGYMEKSKQNHLKMVLTNNENTGKFSLTNYITLENYGDFATLVECKLDTGRTHQIRVHFSSKKYPLIGDQLYGGNQRKLKGDESEAKNYIDNFPRQALISKKIRFIQPTTGEELHFEVDLPDDLKQLQKYLEELARKQDK